MRIALDAMGGDHGPAPNVAGALRAIAAVPDLSVVLVGNQPQIEAGLEQAPPELRQRLSIVHASEVIGMDEKPTDALRKKPDSSIARCWHLVADKQVDGLVSAGNTGAVVATGLVIKRFLKGVRRPGIAAVMPTATGQTVILDVGANVWPKPLHLLHYGVMGSVFAEQILGVAQPKIGLMNVGEEEGKGHELIQKTYELFRNGPLREQFAGNVEGRDIHKGMVDVIVTDGFVGNVVLKHAEGVFDFIMNLVMNDVIGTLARERDLALAACQNLIAKFHYSSFGGAPLLGIDGICMICHGASDERAIANALAAAAQDARVQLNEKITQAIAALPAFQDLD